MGKDPQNKVNVKREFSSGGVVHDFEKNLWLIIKPQGKDRWQLPKGHIEKGESSELAAVREVEEESGIKAEIMRKIGNNKLFFFLNGQRIFKIVTFYLMKYISGSTDNHDQEVDQAAFVSFEQALEKLTFKDDKATLTKAKMILKESLQGNLL